MLPTPSTSHVNYDHIYEPAEDSYLLLDTLSSQSETFFLHSRFESRTVSPLILEVGPGSGVVLAFITAHAKTLFGRDDVATVGVDVNGFACAATKQTVDLAVKQIKDTGGSPGLLLDVCTGDLASVIKSESIDVLIFNPPYVPSESVPSTWNHAANEDDLQRDFRLSSLATDGGVEGMEITNRLLDELPSILSRRGVAYILLCAQNRPDQVMADLRNWTTSDGSTWLVEKVGRSGKTAGWEKLCVLRIWRDKLG